VAASGIDLQLLFIYTCYTTQWCAYLAQAHPDQMKPCMAEIGCLSLLVVWGGLVITSVAFPRAHGASHRWILESTGGSDEGMDFSQIIPSSTLDNCAIASLIYITLCLGSVQKLGEIKFRQTPFPPVLLCSPVPVTTQYVHRTGPMQLSVNDLPAELLAKIFLEGTRTEVEEEEGAWEDEDSDFESNESTYGSTVHSDSDEDSGSHSGSETRSYTPSGSGSSISRSASHPARGAQLYTQEERPTRNPLPNSQRSYPTSATTGVP
jgi:hypothetical protein